MIRCLKSGMTETGKTLIFNSVFSRILRNSAGFIRIEEVEELYPVFHTGFHENFIEMTFNSPDGDEMFLRDLAVRKALYHRQNDFGLAF